jgi:hypothetical protein
LIAFASKPSNHHGGRTPSSKTLNTRLCRLLVSRQSVYRRSCVRTRRQRDTCLAVSLSASMSVPTFVAAPRHTRRYKNTAASHPWGIIVRTRLAFFFSVAYPPSHSRGSSGGGVRTRPTRQILAQPQSRRQKIKSHSTPLLDPPHSADRYMRRPCLCQLSLFIILVITITIIFITIVTSVLDSLHSPSSLWPLPSFTRPRNSSIHQETLARGCLHAASVCAVVSFCVQNTSDRCVRRVFETVP